MQARAPYDICDHCGSHLDHGERCACQSRPAIHPRMADHQPEDADQAVRAVINHTQNEMRLAAQLDAIRQQAAAGAAPPHDPEETFAMCY